jgi:hypothetical protein
VAARKMPAKPDRVANSVANAILLLVARVPRTKLLTSPNPSEAARGLANTAAAKAAVISGSLALPPGPLGWLTILPDLVAIWKLQSQMVADIAAVFGKTATLSQEQMLYCLFRHAAAQAVRDLVARVGERVVVQRATLRVLQRTAERVGVKITQRAAGAALSRWIPILGAVGVGAYAYYDTAQVARTAIELFCNPLEIAPEPRNA